MVAVLRRRGTVETPLSDDYRERPFWWDAAPPPDTTPGDLPSEVDAVVIGAGYTGLGAATELARLGRSVVVLEKHHLAWGASTRNGGMIHPGTKLEVHELLHRFGPLGRRLYDFTVEAFEAAEDLIAREGIECEYARTGHVYLASRRSHVAGLRAVERLYGERLGQAARFVPRERLDEEIGSRAYHAGVVVEKSGGLHPARYHRGLLRLARTAGVSLIGRTPALRVDRRGPGFLVTTARARIRARDVIVATNGYRDALIPWLRRRIVPIGSYIIATEPLDPSTAAEISPNGRMFFDSKNFLNYWRVSSDRRMVFGGRASMAPTTIEQARDTLYRQMLAAHPQLQDVPVHRAWGGKVGFTFDRLPHAGRHDGVYFAGGYCGTGVALSTHLGRCLAAWAAGGEPPPFALTRFPVVPGGRWAERLLPVAGLYYQLRDRIG